MGGRCGRGLCAAERASTWWSFWLADFGEEFVVICLRGVDDVSLVQVLLGI